MNAELLEPLLIDRALGQLAPEVAALLESHLAHTPEAARRAAEIADTLVLARNAVAVPVAPPRRALDVARLRQVHHARYTFTRRLEFFRLAACLAIGLGLGWLARRSTAPAEAASPTVTAIPHSRSPEKEPPVRFWSVATPTPPAIASEHRHRVPLVFGSTPGSTGGQR